MKRLWITAFALLLVFFLPSAFGIERFPPPDFSGGHQVPELKPPAADAPTSPWIDVAALATGLALASWLAIRKRSRAGIVLLSLASIAYFGFWRRGCVCAIGSIQNIALGVVDPDYAVPLVVIAFFTLPLLVALVWGRSFCSGVCPHGALQDLVLVKPVKVPAWLDEILRVFPWIHLAAAVLLAATGSLFIICSYDPFIGIFRMSGSRTMMIAGILLLLLSVFVGRPYCRYICPYGALLGVAARFAKWRPTVTPDTCTQCRLCESSCPFDALNPPLPATQGIQRILSSRRRILLLMVALPCSALCFGWIGGKAGVAAVPLHPDGRLAMVVLDPNQAQPATAAPDEWTAFRRHGGNRDEVLKNAQSLEPKFIAYGRWIGAVFGLVMALKLSRILFPGSSSDYETDHGRCVSCARCFSSCPYELVRRGIPVKLPEKGGPGGGP